MITIDGHNCYLQHWREEKRALLKTIDKHIQMQTPFVEKTRFIRELTLRMTLGWEYRREPLGMDF